MPETTGLPQTYIIAQNPAVLAKLMMENQKRGINPAAYTTPASVFNTLAVGLDDSNPNVSLKTTKLPAADLLKLDPIAESERLRSQFSANSSASQLANPLTASVNPHESLNSHQAGMFTGSLPSKSSFVVCPPQTEEHMQAENISNPSVSKVSGYSLYGSLERHQPPPAKAMHSKGGSLERHQSLMSAQNLVFYNTKPPPNCTNTAERSRSMERNTYFHAYRQQMKTSIECEALPEEIYDFGGIGLKTCVSARQQPKFSPMVNVRPAELGQVQNTDCMGLQQNIPMDSFGVISPHNLDESLRHQREMERQWMTSGPQSITVNPNISISEGAACLATLQAEAMGNQVWAYWTRWQPSLAYPFYFPSFFTFMLKSIIYLFIFSNIFKLAWIYLSFS